MHPNDRISCPSCGEPIPEHAPENLCPSCLLAAATVPEASGPASQPPLRFAPPALDEVAAAFPHLEILGLIGRGGMGAVYKARQPKLDRVVALKVLPPALAEQPEFAERFTREARVLAKLGHPNIVGIHDFGESNGFFFLLMEYVDGVNLRQAMQAGRFTPEQALQVVPRICEALQAAHDQGVLHRDIKPENILLDADGRVKIADFGIAKLLDPAGGDDPVLTGTRAAVGTPQYMAPEQIEQPGQVDHRADLYSLGVVFYEMLTGELPIGRFAPPSSRSAVGHDIDAIVLRALEKERELRQQSASQIQDEIAHATPLRGSGPAPASAPANPPPPRPSPLRDRNHHGVIALVIALLPSMIAVIAFTSHRVVVEDAGAGAVDRIALQRTEEALAHTRKQIEQAVAPERGELLTRANSLEQQRTALQLRQNQRLDSGTIQVPGVLVQGMFLGLILAGTVLAWNRLARQRRLGLRGGRPLLLIAAWFWPLLLLTGTVGAGSKLILLLFRSAGGPIMDTAVGLLVTGLGAILLWIGISAWLSFILVRASLRWLAAPIPPEGIAQCREEELPARSPWLLRGLIALAGCLLLGPLLVILYHNLNAPALPQVGTTIRISSVIGEASRRAILHFEAWQEPGSQASCELVFEGPPLDPRPDAAGELLLMPGDKIPTETHRGQIRRIDFFFPNAEIGKLAALEMEELLLNGNLRGSANYEGIHLLPLFHVNSTDGSYRAWLRIDRDEE